ncbi:aromatic ring-hydroxylating dioxygenase subunit alpha [Clostridia bacterium]|nr:aromatic ring-hydroxylating dioxygenase subunit alpha [Clostridia bacterium]
MIPNRWYAVLSEKELKNKSLLSIRCFGIDLALWRRKDGSYVCLTDQCCHRGASLSRGKVKGDLLHCPFHGFAYDEKGIVRIIPALGKHSVVNERFHINHFKTQIRYGFLWVFYGKEEEAPSDIPFFEELESGYIYGEFSEVWPVHYTRAIENQLDVAHLPFVHDTTIGRTKKTLVHGPVVIWEKEKMTFYVKNEKDDGLVTPLKPDEIRPYKQLFSLQYQVPNIWQNRISDSLKILAAFVPVDENHTRIYLRTYQKKVSIPLLGKLLTQIMQVGNRVVLHQDRRVVVYQKPIKSELNMHENLIQADLPIIEFRKKREQLKGLHKA